MRWVSVHVTPPEVTNEHPVHAGNTALVIPAVQALCPEANGRLRGTECAVRVADRIERQVRLIPTGQSWVESIDVHLEVDQPTLFVTARGAREFDHKLLELRDKQAAEELKDRLRAFWEQTADPQRAVRELADSQQERLLASYQLSTDDPEFLRQDEQLRRAGKGLAERWAAFLADPARLRRLVKRHTLDLGYGRATVVRELLQNIDDAYRGQPASDPPWAEFRVEGRRLVVRHAGRRFNQADPSGAQRDDLLRICSLGGSQKQRGEIGRFGLGFKSVLTLTDEPIVLSHPYYFRVRHVVVPEWEDPERHLGEAWPEWIKDPRETWFIFNCPRERDEDLRELTGRLERGQDPDVRSLLFLHNLRRLNVRTKGGEREIGRIDESAPAGSPKPRVPGVVAELRRLHERGRAARAEDFLVLTAKATVPVPTEAGRKKRQLEYGVAFPWDVEAGCFGELRPGGADLYLYLPTRQRVGLPFLVHGEFLTNLGRTDIDGEQECNLQLAGAVADLVGAVLRAAFALWKGEPQRLKSIYRVVPTPSTSPAGGDWLDSIRSVYAEMLGRDEVVVLTTEGKLAKPSGCALASPLVAEARGRLLAADPGCSVKPLVASEAEEVIRTVQKGEGPVERLTGPALVSLLFPSKLDTARAVRRCRALLTLLFEQRNDRDSSGQIERHHVLSRLSDVPCLPDQGGRLGRPRGLRLPDWATHYGDEGRTANLEAVVEKDVAFKEWVQESLFWAPPPPPPPPVERKELWEDNLNAIRGWWEHTPLATRQHIIDRYSLTGERLWKLVGLPEAPRPRRVDALANALHEKDPDHHRTWFRVLCIANVAQSGRRFEEGLSFLERFDREFNGFDRLWEAGRDGRAEVLDALVHEGLEAVVRDRSLPEQTSFWRRLYDFVKIRHLLQDRQFLEGFWDTADHQAPHLAEYLHKGRAPGVRSEHRGLGESLSSQAFFICRECLRMGLIQERAAENCFFPNRRTVRFVRDAFGPDPGEAPDFHGYAAFSHKLHEDVIVLDPKCFDHAFDIPLLHLASEEDPTRQVPGLRLQTDPKAVREFLET